MAEGFEEVEYLWIHHHPLNLEKAFNLSMLTTSEPGGFLDLDQFKPQAPLLSVLSTPSRNRRQTHWETLYIRFSVSQ